MMVAKMAHEKAAQRVASRGQMMVVQMAVQMVVVRVDC